MNIIKLLTVYVLEEKKSKFIGNCLPYNDFTVQIKHLRKNHPKASHFVYAYRFLNNYDQIVENQSDDGEPKGSSGKPVLAVLRGADLINTAMIIVRYFGGTKLGRGGLVRAYTHCAQKLIEHTSIEMYRKQKDLTYEMSYSRLSSFEHLLKSFTLQDIEKNYNSSSVSVSFRISEDDVHRFNERYEQLRE